MDWIIFILLFVPYFAFASERIVAELCRFCASRLHGVLLALTLIVPYLLTLLSLGGDQVAGSLPGLAKMLVYLLAPTVLLLYRPVKHRPLDWMDILAILILWFPIEFDWLPDASAHLAAGVSLPVAKLTGVDLAFLLFLVIRPISRLGYNWRLSARDVRLALMALVGFCIVSLPLGIAIHFITPALAPFEPLQWLLGFIAIYLLIGVPEELLFRGVIQNLIEQRFGRSWITLLAAALIFGAAHLDNSTPGYPAPNFAYLLMAGIAGVAYGWAWRKSGKITSSALTHTLVDWLWGIVFA
jgi:membrane protease YdiL (CAAX protease family)